MEENLQILLVEDNPADAFLLQEAIAEIENAPRVIHADGLNLALAYLKEENVDAILLDLALPDSEGLATLERMNAAAARLPIVVLTGLEDEAVGIDAVRKGAQDYLIKGQTGARQLLQTVYHAVERKRLERALAQAARRNLLLAEVSARVVAETELRGLLGTVGEAARNLASARWSLAGAAFEDGRFTIRARSVDESCNPVFDDDAESHSAFLALLEGRESTRLSASELKSRAALPAWVASLNGLLAARLVDVQGEPTGAIVLSDSLTGGEFGSDDEAALRQLALITSLALQHIESRTAAEAANVAKSRFLANMSHELRTPMNAILGMTDLALAEELPATVRDCLQTARDSADVLLDLLNEILDLSRIEAGHFELESTSFSIRRVVEQVVKTLRVRAREKGLALIYSLPSDVPDAVSGDPLRFRQIVMNLVDNAIKFTAKGRITVRGEVRERTADFVRLEFMVSDTGIGITPQDQERIFIPFTQADASTTRNYGGSGLGLAISRKLVELMDGQIWVESRPGQGSVFHFTVAMPLRNDAPAGVEGERVVLAHSARRSLTILLAEDTPTNQKLAQYILTKRGHQVDIAQNGRQALQMILERNYEVVLMDVQMPEMDGFQTTAAIRELSDPVKARVPIIAMTAHALKGDAERCLAAGMDAYVSKPLQGDEFIELVEVLGDGDQGPAGATERTTTPGDSASPPRAIPGPIASARDETRGDAPRAVPPFDLNEAVSRCFGKYEFFLDMVNCFYSEADEMLRTMYEAHLQGKTEEVRNTAHRLKNTIVYLGAQPATDAILGVERSAKGEEREMIGASLRRLEVELEVLKKSLAAYRRQDRMSSNIS